MMRMRNKLQFQSLRVRLIIGFFLIVAPIIFFLIYNNVYAMQVVRNQITQSNENMVTLYMEQIDLRLGWVEEHLYNMAAEDTDLINLDLLEKGNNQTYYFSKIQLWQKLSKDILNFRTIDTLFIYSAINEDLIMAQNYATDTDEEVMEQTIKGKFQSGQMQEFGTDQWFTFRINDGYYLCRFVRVGNVYVGALGDVKEFMVPLDLVDLGDNGRALLATETLEPMGDIDFIRENGIDLSYERNVYNLTGHHEDYLVVGEKSRQGNFHLVAVIPDHYILERLPYLQQIIWFIIAGALILLPLLFFLLRKMLLLPIGRLVTAMRKLQDGHLDTRIANHRDSYEFELMNSTFNSMASQIQELKIHVYEEKLNNQKAELNHLQLQINPHFFLNSLNIIYNLAQMKNYRVIQEMTYSLVTYFRFMFRSNLDFVSLRDELEHTRNYLRIQELRFPGRLTYEITAVHSLDRCQIPPLCIQTFVENTMKHGMTMDQPIHIGICAQADGNRVQVYIYDTGIGFPKSVLQQLNDEKSLTSEQGEHIGIWNVQRRLRLLYNGQACITFSNRSDGGAAVHVSLPFCPED